MVIIYPRGVPFPHSLVFFLLSLYLEIKDFSPKAYGCNSGSSQMPCKNFVQMGDNSGIIFFQVYNSWKTSKQHKRTIALKTMMECRCN